MRDDRSALSEGFGEEDGEEAAECSGGEGVAHQVVHGLVEQAGEAGGLEEEEVADEEERAEGRGGGAVAEVLAEVGGDDAETVERGDGEEVEQDGEELQV